jgi:hypothetical protein
MRKTTTRSRSRTTVTTNAPAKKRPARSKPKSSTAFDLDGDRKQMIADAAYFLAEQRGFRPGHELDDWLSAERQIEALLQG